MSNENMTIEFEKNNWYRDQYRKNLYWLVLMLIIAGALSVILALINMYQKPATNYITTSSGIVMPLHSLSEPIITNDYLTQWASLALRKSLNFDFVHYQDQLNLSKVYFTPAGWDKFSQALDKSGLLKAVTSKKLMMTAVVSNTPVILTSDVLHGRFTWAVQLPLLITFSSANQQRQLRYMATMNVQRVSVLDTAEGIQISDFIVERDNRDE